MITKLIIDFIPIIIGICLIGIVAITIGRFDKKRYNKFLSQELAKWEAQRAYDAKLLAKSDGDRFILVGYDEEMIGSIHLEMRNIAEALEAWEKAYHCYMLRPHPVHAAFFKRYATLLDESHLREKAGTMRNQAKLCCFPQS